MYADLVFKGGGIKGIALVGAISYLEEQGYTWRKLAGTSAGAIVASLLAVGYTSKEIQNLMFSMNYKSFIDKNLLQSIPIIGPLASLLIYKGIYSGDAIEKFLSDKFKQKNKTKFRDIAVNGESILKVIATDVTNQKLLILPDDLIKYNINPLDFEIAKAVRMSLSIPFFFKPVVIKNNTKDSFIVDGGLLSNFPIWIFDTNKIPKCPTFGLNLFDNTPKEHTNKIGLLPYVFEVVETSLCTSEDVYFKESDAVRIINIPTLGIKTVEFDISKDEMTNLFESGYKSAKYFLDRWNFESYISNYRS